MPKPTKTRCQQASYEKIVFLTEASDDAQGSVMTYQSTCLSAGLVDVRITFAGRSLMTGVFPVQHSARSGVDNCYRDQAVTNAAQLADLLSSADVPVVDPGA